MLQLKENIGFCGTQSLHNLRVGSFLRKKYKNVFLQFYKTMWPCEHLARTSTKALEEACGSEGPGNLSQ